MDDLFSALRARMSRGENMLEIITDRMVPKPERREDVFKSICADLDMHARDPTHQLLSDLYQRAILLLRKRDLHQQFTI